MGAAFGKRNAAVEPPKGDILRVPSKGDLYNRRPLIAFDRPKFIHEQILVKPPTHDLTPYTPGISLPSTFPIRSLTSSKTSSISSYRTASSSQANGAYPGTSFSESNVPAIGDPPSIDTYTIWKKHFYEAKIQNEDLKNFNTRLRQNADDLLKESEAKLQSVRHQRARLETSLLTEQKSKKTTISVESYVDQSQRYSLWSYLDLKYFTRKPERPVLTDDILIQIKSASRPEPAGQTLVEIDGVQIMRKDMRTLTNLNWLNDEIINAYMHLIVLRGQEPKREKVYAFNTFFFPKVRDSGFTSVKRWTRKVDIFSYSFLLVPVHLGNHWCLAFINNLNRSITYYDSLGGSTNGCCDILLDYLKSEMNDKKKQDFDVENWRRIDAHRQVGIPNQMNGSDCGVFACQFAEHLSRKAKLAFTQEHMPYFRKKMIYELLTKKILE